MATPTPVVDKAMLAADPAAAAMGYLSSILAVFGVFDRLGLNADQIAILGGAILGLVATFRAFYEKGRRAKMGALREANKSLKELVKEASASSSSSNLE